MTPRNLRAFVAVAQTLSFARASERLHMSQPALSLAVKNLEDSLGGRLLSRTTRQVRLTPEGTALLPQAVRLLADWENVRERSRQHFTLQQGHVTIAAMPTFAGNVLPGILQRYRAHFPSIELTVHDVVHEEVLRMVEEGRVELGFCFEPGPDLHKALAFQPLFVDRFIAIVPPDSALAREKSVTWAQLLDHRFIALQRPSTVRRLIEDSLASSGIRVRVALECHQLSTIGQFVAAGLGVSAVPQLSQQQMAVLGAHCLPLRRPVISKAVGLVTRADQQLSTAAAAIRGAVREAFHKG